MNSLGRGLILTVVLTLLTLAYFVVPLRFDWEKAWTAWRLVISLTALALLALVFRAHSRRSREHQSERYLRIQWLLSALYASSDSRHASPDAPLL